jgi:hypothetical protein
VALPRKKEQSSTATNPYHYIKHTTLNIYLINQKLTC